MIKVTPHSLLDVKDKAFTDWYLIFESSDKWWSFIFKKGFGHVYAVRWTGDYWLKLESYSSYLDITLQPCFSNNIQSIVESDCSAILHVRNWRETKGYCIVFGAMSCVEQVKMLLGISGLIFTPWQLYKYLRSV